MNQLDLFNEKPQRKTIKPYVCYNCGKEIPLGDWIYIPISGGAHLCENCAIHKQKKGYEFKRILF